MKDSAAHNLLGMTLKTGWTVIEKITKTANSTGSVFSVCYKVKKDNEVCFLKAFNFTPFFQLSEQSNPGRSIIDVMSDMITAYKYERDLSEHCKNKHVTKVAFVIDAGEETLNNFSINIVPYLIFELADGDVRSKIAFSNKLDFAWKLHSLHDIAVGLQQLHKVNVSHQDLKPSNILVFHRESRLGDLGRSMCKDMDSPYNKQQYTGDWTYAPPEMMYGYYDIDWNKRVFATDCYLLGSMIVFYFAGISMSALLLKHLPDNLRWEKWRGAFDEIKPYLIEVFSKSIIEFRENIDDYYFKDEISKMIELLCYPFPEKRGHPKNVALKYGSNFDLERFITRLDLLTKKAELKIKR
ncbi:MAG: protein kinase [Tannerellaceae bacterium]|jgi:serine/threonine protein kinase|nr:protein kinase [Tannerellaceae bacterium]